MQITYELTQQDFVEGFVAHRDSKPWRKWFMRSFVGFACVLLATAIVELAVMGTSAPIANYAPLTILAFFWFWVYWGAIRVAARKQFRQQPGAHGPRTLALDDWGTHSKWDGGSADVEWKNYIRWVESKKHFLLYPSPLMFNIVPKHPLSSEQVTALREILKQHIAARN